MMSDAALPRTMRLLAPLLAAALLLAGCLSPDVPEVEPADEPAPAAPPDEMPAATASAPPVADEAEPSEQVATAAWEGSTSGAVCASPAHTCQITEQGSASWQEFDGLGIDGRALRVSGTLTWTAETPATEEMRVYVFALDDTGMPTDVQETSGPSPLAFDVDTSGWEAAGYAFSIHGHHEVGPLLVEKAQPFAIETTIVWIASA